MTAHDAPSDDEGRWLPRGEAAAALGVSLRTLDRYLSHHQYQARTRAGRRTEVWLPTSDLPAAGQLTRRDEPAPPLAQWDAMSRALTRQLTPFVETLTRQADELAQLRAENAQLRATLARRDTPPWWRVLWQQLSGQEP